MQHSLSHQFLPGFCSIFPHDILDFDTKELYILPTWLEMDQRYRTSSCVCHRAGGPWNLNISERRQQTPYDSQRSLRPQYWHQSFFGLHICWKKYGHKLHRFQRFYWTEWSTRNNCQSTQKRPLPPWHSDFERGQRLSRSFNFSFLRRPPQMPKPYQLPDHHKNGSHRSRPRSCITVRPTSDWSLPWLRHGQNVLVHFSF